MPCDLGIHVSEEDLRYCLSSFLQDSPRSAQKRRGKKSSLLYYIGFADGSGNNNAFDSRSRLSSGVGRILFVAVQLMAALEAGSGFD